MWGHRPGLKTRQGDGLDAGLKATGMTKEMATVFLISLRSQPKRWRVTLRSGLLIFHPVHVTGRSGSLSRGVSFSLRARGANFAAYREIAKNHRLLCRQYRHPWLRTRQSGPGSRGRVIVSLRRVIVEKGGVRHDCEACRQGPATSRHHRSCTSKTGLCAMPSSCHRVRPLPGGGQ